MKWESSVHGLHHVAVRLDGRGVRLQVGSPRHVTLHMPVCVLSFHRICYYSSGEDMVLKAHIPLPRSCLLPENLTEIRKGRKATLLWIL